MTNEDIQNLTQGLKLLANFRKSTGINPFDNYGWRELMQTFELRQLLPSVKKVPGRGGRDAEALAEGYDNIEFKSNEWATESNKKKIKRHLTFDSWPQIVLDMSKANKEKNPYTWQGFGHSVFNKNGDPIPLASFFISKEHSEKLHSLWDKTIANYKQDKENRKAMGKNVGDERAYINISDFLQCVNEEDMVWFKNGQRVAKYEN